MKQANYHLLYAYTGEEALKQLDKHNIDLVILDVMLPGQSGITVCNQIRERYTLIELPVLMSTVGQSEYDLDLGRRAGANDFIAKPFEKNELLSRVNSLITLKTSMENAVNSEFAFLQAQIKPHFLYNAINTIVSFCYSDGEKAAELLVNFSVYLRLIFDLDNQQRIIPLSRELEVVRVYMEIERARFGDRFRIEYDIDEQLLEKQVPPFCIQPLVENALKHGLYEKEDGGTVHVSVKKDLHVMRIIVRDTGVGISPEKLEQLRNFEYTSRGIGFSNIQRRIRRMKHAHMDIQSVEGEGTTVILSYHLDY